jgi:hypothetical protein
MGYTRRLGTFYLEVKGVVNTQALFKLNGLQINGASPRARGGRRRRLGGGSAD